jgi:Mitochondrial carrier protein
VIAQPAEVVRTRLAVSAKGTYTGMVDCCRKMYQVEGGINPFFNGLVPCLIGAIPASGVNMLAYEVMKSFFFKDLT